MFVSFNDENLRQQIDAACRGYSRRVHWDFFQQLLLNEKIRNICMLGVYFGRDIAYMQRILKTLGRTDCQIVGVDLFADVAGADWPDAIKGKTWEQAGFGPAPTRAAAMANLQALGLAQNVTLVQSKAEEYLASTNLVFDFIYVDVSHDYQTTLNSIDTGILKLHPQGFMGGDDYSDEGTWGVKKAVGERFPSHMLSGNWVWMAQQTDYRAPR